MCVHLWLPWLRRGSKEKDTYRGITDTGLCMEVPSAESIDVLADGVTAVMHEVAKYVVPASGLAALGNKQFVHIAGRCDGMWGFQSYMPCTGCAAWGMPNLAAMCRAHQGWCCTGCVAGEPVVM
jgi:hypothetical protein